MGELIQTDGRLPAAASVIAARLLSVGFYSEGTAFGILIYVRLDVLLSGEPYQSFAC